VCANSLDIELLKIGQILSTCWVALSFQSVSAVWNNYELIIFNTRMIQRRTKQRDAHMKDHRIMTMNFILDLGLMCDALQALSDLSSDLKRAHYGSVQGE
jgi:hypothetical protein